MGAPNSLLSPDESHIEPSPHGEGSGLVYISTSQTESLRWVRARKKIIESAALLQSKNQNKKHRYRVAMITLTYAPYEDWEPKDITRYIDVVSQYLRRRGIQPQYVWKYELTKNLRPHYHVLWYLPRGVTLPKADRRGHWKKGLTRSEWARKPVSYIAKYCAKTARYQPHLGARLYAVGGLSLREKSLVNWHAAPMWLKKFIGSADGVIRHKSGWWSNATTGWGYRTPWVSDGYCQDGLKLRYIGFDMDSIYLPATGLAPPWTAVAVDG